jgi:hypothetical protein
MSIQSASIRNFTFSLPPGFVAVPLDEEELTPDRLARLGADVAVLFGLPAEDPNAMSVGLHLAAFGSMAGSDGVDFAAVGLFRSPDAPDQPIMVLITAVGVPASHDSPDTAITGMLRIHEQGRGTASRLTLPVGPAVALVTEQPQELKLGEESIPVLQRQVSVWIPDRDGTTLAVLSASTNNWRDWRRVCELALGVFETVEWQPLDQVELQ